MRSRSIIGSFDFALQGIVHALRTQRNMRLHVVAAGLTLTVALFFRLAEYELLAIFFAITFVLVTELINTSIEAAVDVATSRFDPMAKVAKDVSAGAVLVAAVNAVAVGYLVFFNRFVSITDTVITQVRNAPFHLTMIAVGLTLITVLVVKAYNREGRLMSGGWPSGHAAVAFSVATATAFLTGSARATVLVGFVAILVAQSRVEAGIHSIPQVVFGAALGSLITLAIFQLAWM
ncbi:MAG: diacylglycerol kinase [Coriobacteriia bacterium]